MSTFTRRLFLRSATVAALALACVAPSLVPAVHAARVDPNSPKGKWAGTFQDENGTLSGNVTLTIANVKSQRGTPIFTTKGSLKLGAAKGSAPGIWSPSERFLTCATIVRRGTAASIAVNLSQDGNTLTGTYGTNTIPNGDNPTAGTVTLTRR
jgi:hypothetical protein